MSSRPSISWTPLVAATAVIALSATSIGVLVAARHVGRPGATLVSAPSARPAVLPGTAQLSAPSTNVVWVLVNYDHLYRSTDRGGHWEQRPMPAQPGVQPVISFVDHHEGWLLAPGSAATQCQDAGAAVWHTTDGGLTWEQLRARGIASRQCKTYISFADSMHGFVGAWDDTHPATVYRTSDGGQTWAATTLLPDPPNYQSKGGGVALQVSWIKAFGSNTYLRAIGTPFIYRSTDGGASWRWVTKVGSPAVVMVTETRWLDLSAPGQFMESVNGGQQFHPYGSDFNADTPVGGPQIVFADASVGYATARGTIQRTVDGGRSWVHISTPGTEPPPTPAPASSARTIQCTPPPSAGWLSFSDSDYGFTIEYPTGDTFEKAGRGNPVAGWMAAYRAVDTCYLGGYPPGQVEVSVFKFDESSLTAWVSKHSVAKCTDPGFLDGVTNVQSLKTSGRDAVTFDEVGKCIAEGPDTIHNTVLLLKSGYVLRVDWWSVNPKIVGTLQATADHMLATLKG